MSRFLSVTMIASLITVWTSVSAATLTIWNGTAWSCTESALRTQIATAKANDTITFKCPANTNIKLTSQLWIDKTLTIDGQWVTLDGQWKTRHFVLSKNDTKREIGAKDMTLTLRNINLINGWWGNIIPQNSRPNRWQPTTTIINKRDGWSIYIGRYGSLVVSGVVFSGNTASGTPNNAKQPDDITVNGGAIFGSFHTKITVTNSRFVNNSAVQDGGAIFVQGGDKGKVALTLTNSTFSNNTANNPTQWGGGAVRVWQNATVTINRSRFVNNTAKREWWALYLGWGNDTITIRNSTFSGNLSEAIGEAGWWAIKIHESPLTLTKNTFTNNRAHNGGAIFNMLSPITASDNTFTSNRAEFRTLDPNSPEYKRLQTTDMKTAVFGNGWVLYQDGSNINKAWTLTRRNNKATNNTASNIWWAMMICTYGKWKQNAIIDQSTFTNNSAGDFGGAIQGQCGGNISISNSTFTNNTVTATDKRKQDGKHIGVYSDTPLVQSNNTIK